MGKIMNALLLDHLDTDLGMVNLLNDILSSGTAGFGEDFVDKLNEAALMRGGHQFRPITTMVVRPTEGIGKLAKEHIHKGKLRAGPTLAPAGFRSGARLGGRRRIATAPGDAG